MTYEHHIMHEGMLAGAWLSPHSVKLYEPSCAHPYYMEKCLGERREEKSEHIIYGTRVFSMAPDGTFILVGVASPATCWAETWTKKRELDDVLLPLSKAVETGSTPKFLTALKGVNWDGRPAEDFIRVIRLALQVGAHVAARKLATEGAELHFDSDELEKYARVLAPAKVLPDRAQSIVDPKANIAWLKANKVHHKGKWIALRNGELLGEADSYRDLVEQVGETKERGILVTPVY